MSKSAILFPALCMAIGAPAVAEDAAPAHRAAALQHVIDCRAVADATQRLACYDASVAAIETAEAKKDIVVVDRQQVDRTRRSLFGFALPSLDLFGGHSDDDKSAKNDKDKDEEQISEITSTVKSARQDAYGNWIIVLDDGATWHQTEGLIVMTPRPGTSVTIKRAALGSYVMRLGKQPGVKAKREG